MALALVATHHDSAGRVRIDRADLARPTHVPRWSADSGSRRECDRHGPLHRADILAGQEVFLKYGLMDNGTVWRHGVYLGPDFFRRVSARGRGRPSGQLAAQQGRS